MDVMVNGERRTVRDGTTVSQLLETLQVGPERVVVEVNLKILKRAEHPQTMLQAGDQVEIVQFVGGGAPAPQATSRRRTTATRSRLWVSYGAWSMRRAA